MLIRYLTLVSWLMCCLLWVSCNKDKKDDEDPVPGEPTIQLYVNGEVAPAQLTMDIGDTLTLYAEVQADASIKSFSGTYEQDGDSFTWDNFMGDSTTFSYEMDSSSLQIDHTLAEKELSFLFTVTDLMDKHDTVVLLVTVNPSPIMEEDAILLGAYGHAAYGNFYNVLSDTAYFPNNLRNSVSNRDGVDFIVSWETDTRFTIMSVDDPEASALWDELLPINWPFTTPNTTRFQRLNSSVSFDEVVTAAQLEALFTANGSSSVATLVLDELIAFRLDDSKNDRVGILQVTGISGNSVDNRHIVLNLKIQN